MSQFIKSKVRHSFDSLLLYTGRFFIRFQRIIVLAATISLIAGPIIVLDQTVSAAQIDPRSLTISNAVANASGVSYVFAFTPGTASTAFNSMTLQACSSPVGTCTAPAGLNIGGGTVALTSGFQGTTSALSQNTTTTTPVDCTLSNDLCFTWTDSTPQNNTTSHVVTVTNANNPSAVGTFFVRMVDYTSTNYTSPLDSGNVAASTTTSFAVNATVQEQLTFCVGSVNGDSTTVETMSYALPTCSTLSGSSLSLGTLTSSDVSVSPMATAQPYNGDLNNAVAELTTNAADGSTITYNAVQQIGTNHLGALRVPGATCSSGVSFTDQCINSVGTTSAAITAGTEDFGMAVMGDNCTNVPAGTYTCNATTHNLIVSSNYDCNSTVGGTSFDSTYFDNGGQATGSTLCNYAWDETGTPETVASATSVVSGEGLIIEFAATPAVTTPTGSYTAEADFVATPTY